MAMYVLIFQLMSYSFIFFVLENLVLDAKYIFTEQESYQYCEEWI